MKDNPEKSVGVSGGVPLTFLAPRNFNNSKQIVSRGFRGCPPLTCLIVFLLAFLFYLTSFGVARAEFPFFFRGIRPGAMGGAFTAVCDDENAIFYNPAGLAHMDNFKIVLDGSYQHKYWQFDAGKAYEKDYTYFDAWAFFSFLIKNVAVGFTYRNRGDPQPYYQYVIILPRGKISREAIMDIDGELVTFISAGLKLSPRISLGITAKYIGARNDLYELFTILDFTPMTSMDLGLLYRINDFFAFGLNFQNLASSRGGYLVRDYWGNVYNLNDLPSGLNMGIKIRPEEKILFSFDLHHVPANKLEIFALDYFYYFRPSYHLGLEIDLTKNLVLRVGGALDEFVRQFSYKNEDVYEKRLTLNAGLGMEEKDFLLNLAVGYEFKKAERSPSIAPSFLNNWHFSCSYLWKIPPLARRE